MYAISYDNLFERKKCLLKRLMSAKRIFMFIVRIQQIDGEKNEIMLLNFWYVCILSANDLCIRYLALNVLHFYPDPNYMCKMFK